jgi:hypothetical protein
MIKMSNFGMDNQDTSKWEINMEDSDQIQAEGAEQTSLEYLQ